MILRVFPRRTSFTPTDEYVRIGEPDMLPLPSDITECHVSGVFTWDAIRAKELAAVWRRELFNTGNVCPVYAGGPGFGCGGGGFFAGRYVKIGVSISSRGCPNNCPWCFVPEREGKLAVLPICPGNIIQDNNVLAFPRAHFKKLCEMLRTQHRITFNGGLEARRLRAWHVEALRTIEPPRIREFWFAADDESALKPLAKALELMGGDWNRQKLRCYVLVGFGGESVAQAEARLEAVWELGCLPFVQVYRPPDAAQCEIPQEWRALRRKWSRPAAMYATHKEKT